MNACIHWCFHSPHLYRARPAPERRDFEPRPEALRRRVEAGASRFRPGGFGGEIAAPKRTHAPLVHNSELRHGQGAADRRRPVRLVLRPPSGCPPHTGRFGHTQRGCRADRRRSEDLRRSSGRSPGVRHASLPEPSGVGTLLPRAGRPTGRLQAGRLEPHGQGPEYISFRGSGACAVPQVGARVRRSAEAPASRDAATIRGHPNRRVPKRRRLPRGTPCPSPLAPASRFRNAGGLPGRQRGVPARHG